MYLSGNPLSVLNCWAIQFKLMFVYLELCSLTAALPTMHRFAQSKNIVIVRNVVSQLGDLGLHDCLLTVMCRREYNLLHWKLSSVGLTLEYRHIRSYITSGSRTCNSSPILKIIALHCTTILVRVFLTTHN